LRDWVIWAIEMVFQVQFPFFGVAMQDQNPEFSCVPRKFASTPFSWLLAKIANIHYHFIWDGDDFSEKPETACNDL